MGLLSKSPLINHPHPIQLDRLWTFKKLNPSRRNSFFQKNFTATLSHFLSLKKKKKRAKAQFNWPSSTNVCAARLLLFSFSGSFCENMRQFSNTETERACRRHLEKRPWWEETTGVVSVKAQAPNTFTFSRRGTMPLVVIFNEWRKWGGFNY